MRSSRLGLCGVWLGGYSRGFGVFGLSIFSSTCCLPFYFVFVLAVGCVIWGNQSSSSPPPLPPSVLSYGASSSAGSIAYSELLPHRSGHVRRVMDRYRWSGKWRAPLRPGGESDHSRISLVLSVHQEPSQDPAKPIARRRPSGAAGGRRCGCCERCGLALHPLVQRLSKPAPVLMSANFSCAKRKPLNMFVCDLANAGSSNAAVESEVCVSWKRVWICDGAAAADLINRSCNQRLEPNSFQG